MPPIKPPSSPLRNSNKVKAIASKTSNKDNNNTTTTTKSNRLNATVTKATTTSDDIIIEDSFVSFGSALYNSNNNIDPNLPTPVVDNKTKVFVAGVASNNTKTKKKKTVVKKEKKASQYDDSVTFSFESDPFGDYLVENSKSTNELGHEESLMKQIQQPHQLKKQEPKKKRFIRKSSSAFSDDNNQRNDDDYNDSRQVNYNCDSINNESSKMLDVPTTNCPKPIQFQDNNNKIIQRSTNKNKFVLSETREVCEGFRSGIRWTIYFDTAGGHWSNLMKIVKGIESLEDDDDDDKVNNNSKSDHRECIPLQKEVQIVKNTIPTTIKEGSGDNNNLNNHNDNNGRAEKYNNKRDDSRKYVSNVNNSSTTEGIITQQSLDQSSHSIDARRRRDDPIMLRPDDGGTMKQQQDKDKMNLARSPGKERGRIKKYNRSLSSVDAGGEDDEETDRRRRRRREKKSDVLLLSEALARDSNDNNDDDNENKNIDHQAQRRPMLERQHSGQSLQQFVDSSLLQSPKKLVSNIGTNKETQKLDTVMQRQEINVGNKSNAILLKESCSDVTTPEEYDTKKKHERDGVANTTQRTKRDMNSINVDGEKKRSNKTRGDAKECSKRGTGGKNSKKYEPTIVDKNDNLEKESSFNRNKTTTSDELASCYGNDTNVRFDKAPTSREDVLKSTDKQKRVEEKRSKKKADHLMTIKPMEQSTYLDKSDNLDTISTEEDVSIDPLNGFAPRSVRYDETKTQRKADRVQKLEKERLLSAAADDDNDVDKELEDASFLLERDCVVDEAMTISCDGVKLNKTEESTELKAPRLSSVKRRSSIGRDNEGCTKNESKDSDQSTKLSGVTNSISLRNLINEPYTKTAVRYDTRIGKNAKSKSSLDVKSDHSSTSFKKNRSNSNRDRKPDRSRSGSGRSSLDCKSEHGSAFGTKWYDKKSMLDTKSDHGTSYHSSSGSRFSTESRKGTANSSGTMQSSASTNLHYSSESRSSNNQSSYSSVDSSTVFLVGLDETQYHRNPSKLDASFAQLNFDVLGGSEHNEPGGVTFVDNDQVAAAAEIEAKKLEHSFSIFSVNDDDDTKNPVRPDPPDDEKKANKNSKIGKPPAKTKLAVVDESRGTSRKDCQRSKTSFFSSRPKNEEQAPYSPRNVIRTFSLRRPVKVDANADITDAVQGSSDHHRSSTKTMDNCESDKNNGTSDEYNQEKEKRKKKKSFFQRGSASLTPSHDSKLGSIFLADDDDDDNDELFLMNQAGD